MAAAEVAGQVNARRTVAIGALLGALGVAAGAFGAHGLKTLLAPEWLDVWQTGARYHQIHAVALLALGALQERNDHRGLRLGATLWVLGIVLFAGSLYALALSSLRAAGALRLLGAITPLGGLALIGGWLAVAWASWRGAAD